MKWCLYCFLLLAACAPKLDQQAFDAQAQTCYLDLMLDESYTVGTYLTRREFNAGLKWECRQAEKAPYPTLFAIVDSMKMCHDDALGNRGRYFIEKEALIASFPSKRKAKQSHKLRLQHVCDSIREEAHVIDARQKMLEARYDSLCGVHSIIRVTHGEYAESLWSRMEQWSDSMEQQGRWIGGGRSTLRGSGLDGLSEEYQALYAPLSQLEKRHKEFQAQLLLVENQHGRFARSRQDEFYYRGPYLVRRHDVEKTEEEIRELGRLHAAFREVYSEFTAGLRSAGLN